MGDKRQLNRGFFLVSKIICSISAVSALCMCLLGQVVFMGIQVNWLDLFSDTNDEEFVFGVIMFIVLVILLIASVLCSWFNVSLVSIIGFILSIVVNTVCWLVIMDMENVSGYASLSVGAWLLIAFCSIGEIFSIMQCISYSKWKGNHYMQAGDYPQPQQNSFNDFSDDVYEEPMTAPLNDIPVVPEPQLQKAAKPQVGMITGVNGSCAGYQVQLHAGEHVVIGKDAKMSNIVIDASYQSVSRRHVGISYDAVRGKYCVTDYSSNGTFVNGNRLVKDKTVFIEPGSEIKIADDKNIFLLG